MPVDRVDGDKAKVARVAGADKEIAPGDAVHTNCVGDDFDLVTLAITTQNI